MIKKSKLVGLSDMLPEEARTILQQASETGSMVQLEHAIALVQQKFPQYFKPKEE